MDSPDTFDPLQPRATSRFAQPDAYQPRQCQFQTQFNLTAFCTARQAGFSPGGIVICDVRVQSPCRHGANSLDKDSIRWLMR